MSKSPAQLREQLSAIEPTERVYEGIGADDVDALKAILAGDEDWLAARAVHALSRIESEEARQAVIAATASPRMDVRVAAAASAPDLPTEASDAVLVRLLDDPEPAVRKYAIQSSSRRNGDDVRRRISRIAGADADPRVRRTAEEQARFI